MKINNKRELKKIAINHSADSDYKDFGKDLLRIHKKFGKILHSSYNNDSN